MAQPIYCDADGCGQVADILVTNLNNGQAQAFCYVDYSALVFEMAARMTQADETDETADDSVETAATQEGEGTEQDQQADPAQAEPAEAEKIEE